MKSQDYYVKLKVLFKNKFVIEVTIHEYTILKIKKLRVSDWLTLIKSNDDG